MLSTEEIQKLSENIAKNLSLRLPDPPELFNIDLLAPLKDFTNWLISKMLSTINTIVTFFKEDVVKPIVDAFNWLWQKVIDTINNTISSIIEWIKNFFTPTDPQKVVIKLVSFTGFSMGLMFSINSVLSILQTQILGNRLNLEPISRFINRALEIPLRYWANATFRPIFPNPSEAWLMWRMGYISRSDFEKIFYYVGGYPTQFMKAFEDIWSYIPSIFDLFRVARAVNVNPSWVNRKLIERGVKDEDMVYLLNAILREPIRDECEKVASDLYYLYVDGWITKEQLQTKLIELGFPTAEIDYRLLHADLLRMKALKEARKEVFVLMFRKDLIDVSTLKNELLNLGLALENVNIIIDMEIARKGIKPIYKVTISIPERKISISKTTTTNIVS